MTVYVKANNLDMVLNQNYSKFANNFYKRERGITMTSCLLGTIAGSTKLPSQRNLVISFKVLKVLSVKVTVWIGLTPCCMKIMTNIQMRPFRGVAGEHRRWQAIGWLCVTPTISQGL